MIDAGEPKDGDFVRYVEELVRMPHGASLPKGYAPGEVLKSTRGQRESLLQTLRDVLTNRDATQQRGRATPGATGFPAPSGAHNADLPPSGMHPGGMLPAGASSSGTPHAGTPHAGTPHTGMPHAGTPRPLPTLSRKRSSSQPGDTAVVARLLGRLASIAIFVGVVLLAMSFAEDPPVPIDPIVGIAMLAGAAVVKRIAKGIA